MVDTLHFREALGRFATGVTIVTTLGSDGAPVGMTANSYNSVSLDPPLVLWSIARSARSFLAFTQAGAFTIHVLGRGQQDIATRFAKSGEDKFGDLEWSPGHGGTPVLPGCAARFECELADSFDGGDHVILVGKVVNFQSEDSPPLLFHRGRFSGLSSHALTDEKPDGDTRFTHDFLYYLLSNAQMLMADRVQADARELGVSDIDIAVLGSLSMTGPLDLEGLRRRLSYTRQAPTAGDVQFLIERGLITSDNRDCLTLSDGGRLKLLTILAQIKSIEDEIMDKIDPEHSDVLRIILRRIIDKLAPQK